MVRSPLLLVGMVVGLVAVRASAQQVTLTMDEVPFQPVNGLSIKGVTFGFVIDGVGSTEAAYNAPNGGIQTYTQDPVIVGSSAGVLILDFAAPTPILKFGVSLVAFEDLSPGFFVTLFDTNLNPIGTTTPVDANILPGCCGFPEGQFSYSGTPVRLAVVRFSVSSDAFAFDNLTFNSSPAPVPLMSTWGSLGLATLLLGVSVLRVRRRPNIVTASGGARLAPRHLTCRPTSDDRGVRGCTGSRGREGVKGHWGGLGHPS